MTSAYIPIQGKALHFIRTICRYRKGIRSRGGFVTGGTPRAFQEVQHGIPHGLKQKGTMAT